MQEDIVEIEKALKCGNDAEIRSVHQKMACKYHNRIHDFEDSMWGYAHGLGFDYNTLSTDSLHENLQQMKYKIEALFEDCGKMAVSRNKILSFAPTEQISLLKLSGKVISSITALVDSEGIFIDDISVEIEENDIFRRKLPNGLEEYYSVVDRGFVKGIGTISDHYQVKVERVASTDVQQILQKQYENRKPVRIFVSHSSRDEKYVREIINLLEDMNVPENGIFCSSIPGYGIPVGEDIYQYLLRQFEEYDLHVFFILSENYYNSVACLNEMGASWVLHSRYTTILLPGFPYSGIQGVINPREIATKLDDAPDTVHEKLAEIRDQILSEFQLSALNPNKWERKRNDFLENIKVITSNIKPTGNTLSDGLNNVAETILKQMIEEQSGKLMRAEDLSGNVLFFTDNRSIMSSTVGREIAEWDNAINSLVNNRYIEMLNSTSRGEKVFRLTTLGYSLFSASTTEG